MPNFMGKVDLDHNFSNNYPNWSCVLFAAFAQRRETVEETRRDLFMPRFCWLDHLVATECGGSLFHTRITPFNKTMLDKGQASFLWEALSVCQSNISIHLLLASVISRVVLGRGRRTYLLDPLDSRPSVCVLGHCRLTVPLSSPNCSGWGSCACVLSSMWKRILLTFRYVGFMSVSVHVCVPQRRWEEYSFSFWQEVCVCACMSVHLYMGKARLESHPYQLASVV